MHRIPGSPFSPVRHGKLVAFLQHRLLDSSAGWILMGPHQGLGYWLADLGYDVWLGNARGNRYSRTHDTNDPDGQRGSRRSFWDFSWHHVGVIDLPAQIDYVSRVTGQMKMHYIGHSMGTTAFFVMASMLPEYNARIVTMNALSPMAYMGGVGSAIAHLARYLNTTDRVTSTLGQYEFLPNSDVKTVLRQKECYDQALFQPACSNVLNLIGGFNSFHMNATMLPVIMGHTPAGASVDQLEHYLQSIRSHRFRQFDHGPVSNMLAYGHAIPPSYNLRNVRAAVSLHYSWNDWMSSVGDVHSLRSELGNIQDSFVVPRTMLSFNHLDFMWANNAREIVYNNVLFAMRLHER